ncbi:roundabout homolog 2-like isoform X1 [Alosa sapidissima]|uniref:roundabout homolog 2-like isoform X1 n=1 Tax=Alosa sapidissima TaxID=34773 RepID=UPI001C098268|nr:roundabout homolog 2-like isoform X1 [Alosa sapidissima]
MDLWIAVILLLVLSLVSITSGSRPRFEDSAPRIVEDPSDLIVSKGEPATLNCKAEGRPVPSVEWYKDGERVQTDRDDPRSHRMLLPSGALFFLRIVHGRRSKPDEGVYTCVARNYLGEAVSRNASLEVAILRDDFRQAPSDVVVAAGEPAVMECVPPRGHPEPTITWKRNNVRLSNKDGRISMRGGKLMISHTRKSDAGMYVCVGSNMVGERDSDPAELVVFERPVFMRRPVNQIVLADDNVDFLCEVHGDPAPTIRWRREEGELPRGRFEIRSDSTLCLLRVREEDEGTYTCVTENSVGKTEASAMLQVHVPPQIDIEPRDQVSTQGRTVTFRCGTTGNPQPAVFWQKEGSQILLFPGQPPSQSGRYSVSMSGELSISDVHPDDAGYYICQAISVAGSTLTKARLEVESDPSAHFPPIIRQGPANQTLALGSTAQLQCHVIGQPLPSVHWEREGQPVQLEGHDPRVSLMENGTLQITDLKETDSGTYTCIASSPSGESNWSGALAVRVSGVPPPHRQSESIQLPGPPQKPVVTDVTGNSVTLTWQPNPHEGGAAVTSYIIEAFSQSEGSTWQTVADLVEQEKHTVGGLYPNTVYLFIVRALNSYGLSDPSPISEPVRTLDGDPTDESVGVQRIQTDFRDATVFLNPPAALSPTSVQISWALEGHADAVQGYRLLYRPRGSAWLVQDLKADSQQAYTHTLSELRGATEYEIKLRPFFSHGQGADSQLVTVRTPDEVSSSPPQNVRVMPLVNSSMVRVTWAPPANPQNGIIQEYRIWCVGNDTHTQVNRSVDGSLHSALLDGLLPEVLYQVEVAAVTSGGVGPRSRPVMVFYKPSIPALNDDIISLSEQITGVVRQPAFIAGIGGASWIVLMSFSAWVYCRHRRRKQLGHYTTSFAYTPAVGFANSEGLINGRPGMGSDLGNYPWLADSWPNTNYPHNGKDSVNCCAGKQDSADRYYNTVGISKYLSHGERFSPSSNDGPIYSTINPHEQEQEEEEEELPDYTSQYSQRTNPYASSALLSKADLYSLERELDAWTLQSEHSTAEYAKLHYHNTGNAKLMTSSCQSGGSLDWADVLALTSQRQPREHTHTEDSRDQQHSSEEDEEDWAPPLPERTYLMDTLNRDTPTLPLRGCHTPSYCTSYSLQSTACLTPSPHDEPRDSHASRLHHLDLLMRSPACAPGSPSHQTCETLLTNHESGDITQPHPSGHWRDIMQIEGISPEDSGKGQFSAFSPDVTSQSPKPRGKKKPCRDGHARHQHSNAADLPPPPEPPPMHEPLQLLVDVMEGGRSERGRMEGARSERGKRRQERGNSLAGSTERRRERPARWNPEDEDLLLHCKLTGLARDVAGGQGGSSLTGRSSLSGSLSSLSSPPNTHTPRSHRREQHI